MQVQTFPNPNNDRIHLTFEATGGEQSFSVPGLQLRDHCQCTRCVSESSGQKRFSTCDIDRIPKINSCSPRPDGSLEVVWGHDFLSGGAEPHTSIYPLDFLHHLVLRNLTPIAYNTQVLLPQRFLWDRAIFQENEDARTVDYAEWMKGGPVFAKALLDLSQWGLVVVKGVPESKNAVQDIANKIGALQTTLYGPTWDVISKPNAENVAYTNEFLCLHQDLMYWLDPPRIQLLHCLKNDCEGGDSLFSDGFRAAAQLNIQSPAHYKSLETGRLFFQYARNGHFYCRTRNVIHHNYRGYLPTRLHWSPPFQGPFLHPPNPKKPTDSPAPKSLRAWHSATKALRDSLEAPQNMLQFRMQPGDCVLFDNHRILHGRTQFDTTAGERHLHGAYLDSQTLNSALLKILHEGYFEPPSRVGDADLSEQKQALQMYGSNKSG